VRRCRTGSPPRFSVSHQPWPANAVAVDHSEDRVPPGAATRSVWRDGFDTDARRQVAGVERHREVDVWPARVCQSLEYPMWYFTSPRFKNLVGSAGPRNSLKISSAGLREIWRAR